jgi:hypothetical protein
VSLSFPQFPLISFIYFSALLLLLLSLFISPAFSHPILPEQILLPSSPSSSEDLSVSALSQSSLSLRPDWLQQKVRPDSEWQRKMELLLGRTNLIKSAEQEAFQEATRVCQNKTGMSVITVINHTSLLQKTATRKGNESFRAAIKQILLGIH